MSIYLSLIAELKTDASFFSQNEEHSIIKDITQCPKNFVQFSKEAKFVLAIMTLGISPLVIKLIEDHRKEKSGTDCSIIIKNLLRAIDDQQGTMKEKSFLSIALPKGESLLITQRFCKKDQAFKTVIEYQKSRMLHISNYSENKEYVHKSLKEIKEMLINDIIKHEHHYSYNDESLVALAKHIRTKDTEAISKGMLDKNLFCANDINHPVIYDERSIGFILKETQVPDCTSLLYIHKRKNKVLSGGHLVLGVVTSDNQHYILSPSVGRSRTITYNGNVKYIKLGVKPGTENIEEIKSELVNELKALNACGTQFENIIKKHYPNADIFESARPLILSSTSLNPFETDDAVISRHRYKIRPGN